MRVGVKGLWVAHNLRKLGPGAFYHLAYPTNQVEPTVLHALRAGRWDAHTLLVCHVSHGEGRQVASGRITAVHWFPELVRIDFTITSVDERGTVRTPWTEPYMVLP